MGWFVVETHAPFSNGRRLSGFWYSLETVKHCIASVHRPLSRRAFDWGRGIRCDIGVLVLVVGF